MKKLTVNEDLCIGCGACVAIDDEHFDFNENGKSKVINEENLESETVKNAISSCPVGAIKCNCDCGDKCECGDDCNCTDDCECKK